MRVSQDGEQRAWESWHEVCPQGTAPGTLQVILRHHSLKERGAVFSLPRKSGQKTPYSVSPREEHRASSTDSRANKSKAHVLRPWQSLESLPWSSMDGGRAHECLCKVLGEWLLGDPRRGDSTASRGSSGNAILKGCDPRESRSITPGCVGEYHRLEERQAPAGLLKEFQDLKLLPVSLLL